MSSVSYFQRYSQRENHATNNTLLLLRHAYQTNPLRLQNALKELFADQPPRVGLDFEQQIVGEKSVPDALIHQEGFQIYVEAKRGGSLDTNQIVSHLASIRADSRIGCKYLLGLTRTPIDAEVSGQLRATANSGDVPIMFAATTFSQIAELLQGEFAGDEAVSAIVADYVAFLEAEALVDDLDRWLMVPPCGGSYALNKEFELYFDPPNRPLRQNRFLGIYAQKEVSLIGEIEAVAVIAYLGGALSVTKLERGEITPDHLTRVLEAMESSSEYDLKTHMHRYYMMGRMVPTNLRKDTPGGLQGLRYLDITKLQPADAPKRIADAQDLAARLDGRTFS